MILAACVALFAAAQTPPAFNADILIQFDQRALSALTGWDGTLDALADQLGTLAALPEGVALRENALARLDRAENAPPDFSQWMVLSVPATPGGWLAAEAQVQRLARLKFVAHAELDRDAAGWKREPTNGPAPPAIGLLPNDPYFTRQYYHHQIHTPEAWSITTGAPFITVAVLDAGFDTFLSDFGDRLEPGYNFVTETPVLKPEGRHGTAITALIAATGDDCEGIAGVDWQCRVLPVDMITGGATVWAEALEYAIRQHVNVINISGKLELGAPSPILEATLQRAHTAGIVIVASAGNQDLPQMAWPASSPYVIAVGATDGFDARWRHPSGFGSNYGPKLDLVAPGEAIITLDRNGHTVQLEGTSAAAALVSGACSLMLSVNPTLEPEQVREILRQSADTMGPSASNEFGAGRLNVLNAVQQAQKPSNHSR